MPQMKEQENTFNKTSNVMERSNFPYKEFKEMVIRMLHKLESRKELRTSMKSKKI